MVAEDRPLTVIYEDQYLLVIDKPAGLVVHPAPGHRRGTVVNALLAHCGDKLADIGGKLRPGGIVHRLDKDTSGLLVVAKTEAAHRGGADIGTERAHSKTELSLFSPRLDETGPKHSRCSYRAPP